MRESSRPRIPAGLVAACVWMALTAACSRSNYFLEGRVEAQVGGHTVVVTDCYRLHVPAPERLQTGAGESYRFVPCQDADVIIRAGELVVNGTAYGHLRDSDTVTVDHGRVLINGSPAAVH